MSRWPTHLAICLLLASGQTTARDLPTGDGGSDGKPLWEWHGAVFGRYGSSYPASEEMQVNLVPLPIPIYRGRFLRLFEDGENPIRGRIFESDRIKLDLDLDLTFPSDSDSIAARVGMPDLDLLVQAGPEIDMQFVRQEFLKGRWHLALQSRAAVSFDGIDPKYQGLNFSAEFRYITRPSDRDKFKFRITPTFATGRFMEYYYQVDPQFVTPERPAYGAKGGYLGTDFTWNWTRTMTKKLSVWVGARLSVHSGARNDQSPLFTREVTPSVYGAFMYRFWESKRRAVKPAHKAE
ncbi:MAG: MipA/OmpV family protein [Gammaproteobacteria bacterium]